MPRINSADIALDYDGTTDDSTDMAWRGGFAVQAIARRNARGIARLAECDNCGDTIKPRDMGTHAAACYA